MARVCVIGAGAAGLSSGRHLVNENISCLDILEQSEAVGGTWVYTEKVGHDSFGLPVHTSMYKSLRTNLPKEIMGFPDYPVPDTGSSYIPAKDMLKFLQDYADTHGVTRYVKFKQHVDEVKPKKTASGVELWDVTYTDLNTNETKTKEYDYVFVCNGHYNTPHIPKIPGMDKFKGDIMHSHDYRVPEIFTGKKVLAIGAGPSGLDIAVEIASVAEKVLLSHHHKEPPRSVFPKNLFQKPDVTSVNGNMAVFADGSEEADVDVILLCTGYLYNFPFLHKSCDIVVSDSCVEPLYKHMVNINHPTMCLIGIPFYVCAFAMFDLQVRFYVRSMNGSFKLPSKQQMIEHAAQERKDRAARGFTRAQTHMMGPDQEKYYASLADEAGTETLPSVLTKIREESFMRFFHNLTHYRYDKYNIIDDQTYEIVTNGKSQIFC